MSFSNKVKTSSGIVATGVNISFAHTPTGTPNLVLFFMHFNGGTDTFPDGDIKYGGVAMTRYAFAQDTAGETMSVYAFYLKTGIPTGTQNVTATTAGVQTKFGTVYTLSAAGTPTLIASNTIGGDTANPSITLDSGAQAAMGFAILGTGLNTGPSGVTEVSPLVRDGSADYNPTLSRGVVTSSQTSETTGSRNLGFTSASDDAAMIAAIWADVAGASIDVPMLYLTLALEIPDIGAIEVGNVTMPAEIVMYGSYVEKLYKSTEHMETGTYGILLLTANAATLDHNDVSITDVLAGGNTEGSSLTGYARITGISSSSVISRDTDSGKIRFKPALIDWTALGAVDHSQSVVGAILYKEGANDGSNLPILWVDFTTSVALDGDHFRIRWPEAAGAARSLIVES